MSENQGNTILQNNLSVLISGGSGLIGRYLTSALLSEGYKVSHLSRNASQFGKVRVYRWNPGQNIIDSAISEGFDYIIHLAGANIGEKRWKIKRKEEIVKSRVNSARLLFKTFSETGNRLKAFITASATGYYGSITSDHIYNEQDPPGDDFLGTTCLLWEEAADLFQNSGIRTVKLRTSVVLEKSDSALSKLMMPAKFGFLVKTGSGRQYMPWIHISDLVRIYLMAVEDQNITGAYNATSPNHVTHNEFIKTLSQVMAKPVLPVPVPASILRLALGEMSDIVLKGSRVSSEKLTDTGFKFRFNNLSDALNNVINN